MFGWFKRDPVKKLQKAYEAKLSEAKEAEKFGDRGLQATLYAEAESIYAELEAKQAEAEAAG